MSETTGRLRLRDELARELAGASPRKRKVRFLLGTDEYIHRETRVALVPRHMAALGEVLTGAGLEPELLMIEGAGSRAGYEDREYEAVGVRVIPESEVSNLHDLDVFHALKEPTHYESEIPGPFLRIGALHLASLPPGVCRLLARKNFSAIFDGGTVGFCSFLLDGSVKTPIVASMSSFAGYVAGVKLVEGLDSKGLGAGKIVVVGGGVAGLAAVDELGPKLEKLIVVESFPPTRERLPAQLRQRGIGDFSVVEKLTDEAMDGAIGIIFAHRSGAKAAEKVCTEAQIRRMKPGAAIVDIAIDQGGSILHPGYSEDDSAAESLEKYRSLLADYAYYAETNMPREVPREASQMHGDASWLYVTTLLALTALHGGPEATAKALLSHDVRHFRPDEALEDRNLLDCLSQDLRNGLQLAVNGERAGITDPEVGKNEAIARWVDKCAAA